MIVGCLKEIKDNENRVALTPQGAKAFVQKGHAVLLEKNSGKGSGFSNAEYRKAGASIIPSPKQICSRAELVLKIKEPLPREYGYFHANQLLFTYFHFASSRKLTEAMVKSKATCIAYETVEERGKLPLLKPMSIVAGKMSTLIGAYYLAKFAGGKGILASSVGGVQPAKFLVVGGGNVGENAARVALGIGADVTVLDISAAKRKQLKRSLRGAKILPSTPKTIQKLVPCADVLVGAVLVSGAKAPKVVPASLVKRMQLGSVMVDVAIDQGGCIATSKPTSHSKPVFRKYGVTHYCVTNMPGAFPRTSTLALTNATLPYALQLARFGEKAFKKNSALAKGANIFRGRITNEGIARAFNMQFAPISKLL